MHILVIPKNTYNKMTFKKYLTDKVHYYIGSNKPVGLSGLGQTVSELNVTDDLTGNEFLSTMSSFHGGTFSFTRLPEKLHVQAMCMKNATELTPNEQLKL